MLPEIKSSALSGSSDGYSGAVELKNFCASWKQDDTQGADVLSDISLEVTKPELIGVIGPVGCGKSSLVMAILGELPATSGSIDVRGTVSYVAQQPWVFSATIRENIIFGRQWDQEKYEQAIKGSALQKDLEQFPNGDQTMVGERGVSLSGGQRARVGLARALYSDSDIYLLDDPLSAVDAAVGKHLFNKCIRIHLHNKIRILVTHQLQYLKAMDRVIVLQNGSTLASGTYSELVEKGLDLNMIVKTSEDEEPKITVFDEDDVQSSSKLLYNSKGDIFQKPKLPSTPRIKRYKAELLGSSLSLDTSYASAGSFEELSDIEPEELPKETEKQEDEQRAEGTITWRVYLAYFMASGNAGFLLLLFLLFSVTQASYVLCDWWLALWMQWEQIHEMANFTLDTNATQYVTKLNELPLVGNIDSTMTFLWIYCGLTVAVLITSTLRSLGFYSFTLCSSHRLHKNMLLRVLHAPIRFFDTNSAGRILNRFSKDTGVMDETFPPALSDFFITSFLVAGNLIVNFVISPWTIIPVLPLAISFLFLRKYYMKTSRDVKRIEAVARSPVFAHVNNTLLGLATVRSSKSEQLFSSHFEELQDEHSRAWYAFLCTSRWFGIRLDWLCVFFVIIVCYVTVISSHMITDAKAGLMITYAVGMLGMFQWCVRQSTEVENQMVSVERIVEYTKLLQEPPYESPRDQAPPKSWPESSIIQYEDVDFRYYDDGPLVLKSLSWQVKDGEKIGIVGRTGAGKSSLVMSLFRLAEVSAGKIVIDKRSVGPPMGLHELRSRISIIPQDPVLFTGTVRWNLDPMEQQADDAMWRALEDVQMKKPIKAMSHGLDSKIAEGGINLSVGQRQLICLARALLGKNRILIIDEATANVDPRTDDLIQETIRSKFSHCTVLTIAHRLHTIMDSHRIMVLDDGRLVEFDHPHLLLHRPDSHFHAMVHELEEREVKALRKVAEKSYCRWRKLSLIQENLKDKEELSSSEADDTFVPETIEDIEVNVSGDGKEVHEMALLNGSTTGNPHV